MDKFRFEWAKKVLKRYKTTIFIKKKQYVLQPQIYVKCLWYTVPIENATVEDSRGLKFN